LTCHTVHQLQCLPADRRQSRELAPTVATEQLLEFGAEEAIPVHTSECQKEDLLPEHGFPTLRDVTSPLRDAARALHEREAGELEQLARVRVGPGITDSTEESCRRHRCHPRYG